MSRQCRLLRAANADADQRRRAGGPSRTDYYDCLRRLVATDTQTFSSSLSRVSYQYNASGNLVQQSRPYFVSGGTPVYTTYSYDALHRVTQVNDPDGGVATHAFHGVSETVTNPRSFATTTVKNGLGWVVTVNDALSHTATYAYDAFGNPTHQIHRCRGQCDELRL